MNKEEITKGVVKYLKSDQWQELMRQLTQTDEEIYHTHVYVENKVGAESLYKLVERYFKRKGLALDRKIDILAPNISASLALHNVHPHNPERNLYTPHFDLFWKYNPDVVIEASPSLLEEGKNIIGWGKKEIDNFLKQFEFKCVGPREEWEIYKYFQSSHWKKFIELMVDPSYDHVHVNVEINFDPWILKVLAVDALKEIGWQVDHVVPCIYHPPDYLGKIIFLLKYPERVHDIAWFYNPDVVIKPFEKKTFGRSPKDGDPSFLVCYRDLAEERIKEPGYEELTDEQIEDILAQV